MTAYPTAAAAGDKLELQLGDAWTDLTSRAGPDGLADVTATSGSPDGSQQASPATMTTLLDNADAALTIGQPMSPWYGQLQEGTPGRLSVAGATTRLRIEDDTASGCGCPATSGLGTGGSPGFAVDIQVDADITSWTAGVILAKYCSPANVAWSLLAMPDGLGLAVASSAGAGTATSILQPPGGRVTLRASLVVSTGMVTFYYGAAGNTGGSGWTQLGPAVPTVAGMTVTAATASLRAGLPSGSVDAAISTDAAPGSYFAARVAAGATVVASPNWSAQAPGTTSFADSQGSTWSVTGTATITDRDFRLHGLLSASQRTSTQSGGAPQAQLTIAGPLRRIQQGNEPPLASPIRRAIQQRSGSLAPIVYWPWEDSSSASALASAVPGVRPIALSSSRPPQLAGSSVFACSDALPMLGTSAPRAVIPAYAATGTIVVRFLLQIGSTGVSGLPSGGWPLVRVFTTGTAANFDLLVFPSGAIGIQGGNQAGSVFSSGAVVEVLEGVPVMGSLEVTTTGSSVDYGFSWMTPGSDSETGTGTVVTATAGRALAVGVHAGALSDTVFGHLFAQTAFENLTNFAGALNAWQDELTSARIGRLGREEGLATRIACGPSAPMGAQRPATLQALLSEAEATDGGMLHEPRDSVSIGYRPLASLYAQPPALTLDASAGEPGAGELGAAPTAADDDTLLRNDWTASDALGNSARVILDDGSPLSVGMVGTYADTVTVNPASASQLPDVAGVLLSQSAAAGPRYSSLTADLGVLSAAQAEAARRVSAGDLIVVTSMPLATSPTGSIRQIAAGATEAIGPGHKITWATRSAAPYDVLVLDDLVRGRYDTGGSTLAAALAAPLGPVAIPDAGLTGWTAFGAAITAAAAPDEWSPPRWARWTSDGTAFGNIQAPPIGAAASTAYTVSGLLWCPVAYTARCGVACFDGSGANLGDFVTSVTVAAGTVTPFAVSVTTPASTARARPEVQVAAPASGDVVLVTALCTWAGSISADTQAGSAPWSPNSIDWPFDVVIAGEHIRVISVSGSSSPQALTGARGINGVTKALAAGADVRLWYSPLRAAR